MTSMKIVMMVKRRSNASGILNMVWEPLRLREAPCAPCSAATPCEATPMPGCACSAISSARADAVRSSRSARFCCSLASGSADATMPADATWSAARSGTGASACAAHTRSAASIGYVGVLVAIDRAARCRACRAYEGVPWLSPLTLRRDPLFSDAHAQSQSSLHIEITCKLRYLLCDHTTSARHRRSTLRDAAATARKRCRSPCTWLGLG